MTGRKKRLGLRAVFILLVAALAIVAAGCGGDDSSSSSTQIEGLGTSLEEIQTMAKDEGQVDLVNWAGYVEKDWVTPFEQQTGCKVNSKVGASSDEMVTLMKTGNYDGVSASGDATLRLIASKTVAPVNFDLIPNYENVFEGLKNQPHNTVDGVSYGVAHGRGANLLVWNTKDVTTAPTSWDIVWDANSPAAGKISVYDSPIYIADAALHLKTTQPDLKIDNIYELDQTQFDAAVNLLKEQKKIVGEYWSDAAKQIQSFTSGDSTVRHDLAVPGQPAAGRQGPGARRGDPSRRRLDRLVGHLDDCVDVEAPELHVPLDGLHHQPGGERQGDGVLRRGPGLGGSVQADGRQGPLHQVPCRGRGLLLEGLLLDDAGRRVR